MKLGQMLIKICTKSNVMIILTKIYGNDKNHEAAEPDAGYGDVSWADSASAARKSGTWLGRPRLWGLRPALWYIEALAKAGQIWHASPCRKN